MTDEQIVAKRHRMPYVDLFEVSADELDNIQRIAETVGSDLQFATFFFPIGLTSLLTLILVPIQNEKVSVSYQVAVWVGLTFGLYFFYRWWRNRKELRRYLDRIRDRAVGLVGEQGKELKPSELAALPSVPPAEENQK